jgi:hypothetical protein
VLDAEIVICDYGDKSWVTKLTLLLHPEKTEEMGCGINVWHRTLMVMPGVWFLLHQEK